MMYAAAGLKHAKAKTVLYSAEFYDEYIAQLHAQFSTNKHAVVVLSGFRKDPIQRFKKAHKEIVAQLDEDNLASEEEVFKDPVKTCRKFVQELAEHLYLDEEKSIDKN